MLLGRRIPVAGGLVLALVAGFFVVHLLTVPKLDANVADIEHLVALFTGADVEWSLAMMRSRRPLPITGPALLSVAGVRA